MAKTPVIVEITITHCLVHYFVCPSNRFTGCRGMYGATFLIIVVNSSATYPPRPNSKQPVTLQTRANKQNKWESYWMATFIST